MSNVLLIDENHERGMEHERNMLQRGYKVVSCYDVEHAMTKLEETDFVNIFYQTDKIDEGIIRSIKGNNPKASFIVCAPERDISTLNGDLRSLEIHFVYDTATDNKKYAWLLG